MVSSGLSPGVPLGGTGEYCAGSRDWWLGRLDDGVPAAFCQHVPGLAEVGLVGFFGGNALLTA